MKLSGTKLIRGTFSYQKAGTVGGWGRAKCFPPGRSPVKSTPPPAPLCFDLSNCKYTNQGSRKCGSTGAALLGNSRPNRGNDANWEKGKIRKEKKANGKWGKKMKGKTISYNRKRERKGKTTRTQYSLKKIIE